jgi:hypothetical protein
MTIPDEARRDLTGEQIVEWSDSWTEGKRTQGYAELFLHAIRNSSLKVRFGTKI